MRWGSGGYGETEAYVRGHALGWGRLWVEKGVYAEE